MNDTKRGRQSRNKLRNPLQLRSPLASVLFAFALGSIFCLSAWGRPGAGITGKSRAEADALFTNGLLHVLKIDLPRTAIRSLNGDPRKYVSGTMREGTMVWTNVLVRLKGGAGSFRSLDDKPGLTIELGPGARAFHGLSKFHLNNSVQDGTYLSEWMCSELFREAGVPAARVAHALVQLNGRNLGLYVLLEGINSDFLAQSFKDPHGNVYSVGANAEINHLERMGGREDPKGPELQALVNAARKRDASRFVDLLDLPRFLSFMAVEVMLDHWDGYTLNVKNYTVYHNPEKNKIVFLPHDMDQVLRDENAPILPRAQGLIARTVLDLPMTRTMYQRRFREIYTNEFNPSKIIQRIRTRAASLSAQLAPYDPGLAPELEQNARDLEFRVERRARALALELSAGSAPKE